MPTFVLTKKQLIETIDKSIGDEDVVVLTSEIYGSLYAASKRIPLVRVPMAFAGDAFKTPEGLNNSVGKGQLFGFFTTDDKNVINESHHKGLEEQRKKESE